VTERSSSRRTPVQERSPRHRYLSVNWYVEKDKSHAYNRARRDGIEEWSLFPGPVKSEGPTSCRRFDAEWSGCGGYTDSSNWYENDDNAGRFKVLYHRRPRRLSPSADHPRFEMVLGAKKGVPAHIARRQLPWSWSRRRVHAALGPTGRTASGGHSIVCRPTPSAWCREPDRTVHLCHQRKEVTAKYFTLEPRPQRQSHLSRLPQQLRPILSLRSLQTSSATLAGRRRHRFPVTEISGLRGRRIKSLRARRHCCWNADLTYTVEADVRT